MLSSGQAFLFGHSSEALDMMVLRSESPVIKIFICPLMHGYLLDMGHLDLNVQGWILDFGVDYEGGSFQQKYLIGFKEN